MACTSNTITFSKYIPLVKFNLSQIRNFFQYFKKYSGGADQMKIEEFRNSIGIIGNNCGEFICQRLFDLIKEPGEKTISFENYLKFLNLVNNGTVEEKLKHSFKFMDVENKGFIDKENFRKTIYALCEFFEKVSQTQSKLKEDDIEFIFKEILSKTEKSILDFSEYLQLVSNYPEIFDFFDIFNNKLVENSLIVLNREHFSRLKNISEKLKSLVNKVDMINLKYGEVTLAMTNFIQNALKNEKKLKKLKKLHNIRENTEFTKNNENKSVHQEHLIKSNGEMNYMTHLKENLVNSGINFKNTKTSINSQNDLRLHNLDNNPKQKIFFLSEKVLRKDDLFDDDEIEVSDISDDNTINEVAVGNFEDDDIGNEQSKSEKFLTNFTNINKNNNFADIQTDKNMNFYQIKLPQFSNFEKTEAATNYRSNTTQVKPKNELPIVELKPMFTYSESKENEEKSSYSNGRKEKENPLLTSERFTEYHKDKNFSFMKKDEFFGQSLDFDFLTPAPVIHKELSNSFKEYDLDPENCLIITNKKNFNKWISNISDALKNVLNEIDPRKKNVKRRAGISKKIESTNSFDKNDYLNLPFLNKEEEGLIHFGNPNVELVLNMMIGIRNSLNSIGETRRLYNIVQKDEAFKELNRFKFSQNNYEKELICTFYDHAPKVFYNLRKFYGITNQDYLKSLGPENFLGNLILIKNRSLRELCSSGKSGSFFYYSYDSKFVLKTISLGEFEFFQSILEDYYLYVLNNKDTLIPRFYGLHTIIFNDEKIYIVIMNNVFNTNIKVHYLYDLKGSTHQRISRKRTEINYDDYNYSIPLKDLDFLDREEAIIVSQEEKENLINQLRKDADFLSSKRINDYSLLIGIHNDDFYNSVNNFATEKSLFYDFLRINSPNLHYLPPIDKNKKSDFVERKPFYEFNNGGLLSRDGKKIYFFGLIDIFTQFGYVYNYFNFIVPRKNWSTYSSRSLKETEFLANHLMNMQKGLKILFAISLNDWWEIKLFFLFIRVNFPL